jgi:hypothetical protein
MVCEATGYTSAHSSFTLCQEAGRSSVPQRGSEAGRCGVPPWSGHRQVPVGSVHGTYCSLCLLWVSVFLPLSAWALGFEPNSSHQVCALGHAAS